MLTVFRKLVKGGGIDDMSGGGRRRLKAPTSPFLSLLGSSFTSPLLTSFAACHTLPLPSFDFCSQHSLLPLFTPELVIACHGPWPHSFIIFAQKKKAICITCWCQCCAPWSWNWITTQLPLCLSYMERKGVVMDFFLSFAKVCIINVF
jgi:hypothetical protein